MENTYNPRGFAALPKSVCHANLQRRSIGMAQTIIETGLEWFEHLDTEPEVIAAVFEEIALALQTEAEVLRSRGIRT